MLKGQDVVILLKILANLDNQWSQRELAKRLCMSQSEVSSGLKRLKQSKLITISPDDDLPRPIIEATQEYLLHGLKYSFPAKLGEMTPGIATSIGAPVLKRMIVSGNEPPPVWSYTQGESLGLALQPLYRSVPKSIIEFPDNNFYELLTLVDAIRHGGAKVRLVASNILKEILSN